LKILARDIQYRIQARGCGDPPKHEFLNLRRELKVAKEKQSHRSIPENSGEIVQPAEGYRQGCEDAEDTPDVVRFPDRHQGIDQDSDQQTAHIPGSHDDRFRSTHTEGDTGPTWVDGDAKHHATGQIRGGDMR